MTVPGARRRTRALRALPVALALTVPTLGCATLDLRRGASADSEVRPDASADYDFVVGREHELGGRLPEAIAAYERAVAKDPDSAFLERKLAELNARVRAFDEALVHAERAHELDPDDPRTRLFLASLYRVRRDLGRVALCMAG